MEKEPEALGHQLQAMELEGSQPKQQETARKSSQRPKKTGRAPNNQIDSEKPPQRFPNLQQESGAIHFGPTSRFPTLCIFKLAVGDQSTPALVTECFVSGQSGRLALYIAMPSPGHRRCCRAQRVLWFLLLVAQVSWHRSKLAVRFSASNRRLAEV